jgi:hypothetical protein
MKKNTVKLLVVSFDALGDRVFDRAASLPNTAAFLRSAALTRGVSSVFLTNTYPIHASIVTGRLPEEHGLISNTQPFPVRHPAWCYRSSDIRTKTLWQAAAEKGLTTAAVLWPVTGGAPEIRWNLPEIAIRPTESQLLMNMKYGTRLTQLRLWLKYRHLMDGISQPALDRFSSACMADILRRHQPDLALMHFTAYDSLCHKHGEDFAVLDKALRVMDEGFGMLLEAAGDQAGVILFSDHGQLPVQKSVLPNNLLVEMGLLGRDEQGYVPGESGCFIECCGGSAFVHPGTLKDSSPIRRKLEQSPGFNRWLTGGEMRACGRPELPAGFCALPGYHYEAFDSGEKGQHGYPADYGGYGVFYAARGASISQGKRLTGGSLLDITPLALRLLGAGLPSEKAPVIPGLSPARADFFE